VKTLAQRVRARGPAWGLALLALGYLLLMVIVGTQPERVHLIRFEANGVMVQQPELITRASVISVGKSVSFKRTGAGWQRDGDNAPLAADLIKSIDLAVKFMHTAEPVRVFKASEVAADAATEFGLTKPALSVRLQDNNGTVLEADFGNLSSDGLLHYMRIKGRAEFFLMSRFVLHEWQTVAGSVQ